MYVSIVSTVGDDALGAACLRGLMDAAVDVKYVRKDPHHATGMALVFSESNSKRMISFSGPDRDDAYRRISSEKLTEFHHLHVSGPATSGLIALVQRAQACSCTVSVEWSGRDMSVLASPGTLNFMNLDELSHLLGQEGQPEHLANELAAKLKAHVIITCGAQGAIWTDGDELFWHEPTVVVKPVDRTGGGDAFDAGVIAGFLLGWDRVASLRCGLEAASEVISRLGA
jgi:ribokinase